MDVMEKKRDGDEGVMKVIVGDEEEVCNWGVIMGVMERASVNKGFTLAIEIGGVEEGVTLKVVVVELEVKFLPDRGISLVMAIPVTLAAFTLSPSALNTRDWLIHGGDFVHASQVTLPPRGSIHKTVLHTSINN